MHASFPASATVLAALALSGCGGDSDGGTRSTQPSSSSATAAATTSGTEGAASASSTGAAVATPAAAPTTPAATPAAPATAAAAPPAGDPDAPPAGHPEQSTRAYAPGGSLVDLGKDVANNTGFLGHWIVLGPFPNPGGRDSFDDPTPDFDKVEPNFRKDFLATSGGEPSVVPKLGDKVTVDKVSYAWEQIDASSGEPIDIRAHYENSQRAFLHTIAYIADYIKVDEAQKVSFGVGSDDGYEMWVNGEFVTKHHIHRGVTLDDDFVPVSLRAGVNMIMLKVDTDLGGWGALVRIVGKDYAEVKGIQEYALPTPAAGASSATAAATPDGSAPASH